MYKINKFVTSDCTGCRACEQNCPKNSIEMIANAEGFLIANKNNNSCIGCGLCERTCPQLNIDKFKMHVPDEVYGSRCKDNSILKSSSSGGLFTTISNWVLDNDGVVFGCAFDKKLNPIHIYVNNNEDLVKLRGSKYVQSDTLNTYSEAINFLNENRWVLYSGTSCQIAGLKSLLKKNYSKLITVDIICHGVASPMVFNDYISWLEQKSGIKVIDYNFRSKDKRKKKFIIKQTFQNKVIYKNALLDPYYSAFLSGKMFRESCYQCKYASKKRVSDITLGDFWGVEKVNHNFDNEKDTSLVLINSKKGKEIFATIKTRIEYFDTTYEEASKYNKNIVCPKGSIPPERLLIFKRYRTQDINTFFSQTLTSTINWKKVIFNMLPHIIRKFIKIYF